MCIDTNSNKHGNIVFVGFERTDIVQLTNLSLYYNSLSILTNDSLKSMACFRIPLILEDSTWSTRYNIPKNDRFTNSSTQWTKLSLKYTEEIYGKKLIYNEIDTLHADLCFSNITIILSVY